jgi:hypothetical protein
MRYYIMMKHVSEQKEKEKDPYEVWISNSSGNGNKLLPLSQSSTDSPTFNGSYKLSQLLGVKFNIIYRHLLIFHIGSNIPHYPVGSQLHISTLGNCCIKKFSDLKIHLVKENPTSDHSSVIPFARNACDSTNTWIKNPVRRIIQACFTVRQENCSRCSFGGLEFNNLKLNLHSKPYITLLVHDALLRLVTLLDAGKYHELSTPEFWGKIHCNKFLGMRWRQL